MQRIYIYALYNDSKTSKSPKTPEKSPKTPESLQKHPKSLQKHPDIFYLGKIVPKKLCSDANFQKMSFTA